VQIESGANGAGLAQRLGRIRIAQTLTIHGQARTAGVSPAALIDIRHDRFGPADPRREESQPNQKQRIGWAQTLTRLVEYANANSEAIEEETDALQVDDVLREFGLDAEEPAISHAIRSVQGQAGQHRHISDPVFRQIALRRNEVSLGVLKWGPFFDDDDTSASGSWAGEYAKRLVGSINPTDWQLGEIKSIDDFDAAVSALGSGSPEFDAIFGVYDTPNKRLRGLRFLTLPGIAMPLSFVCIDGRVSWEDIVSPSDVFRREMQAIVLEGEVGDLFLLGPCQYNLRRLERFRTLDLDKMVALFFSLIRHREGAPIFFCADRTTCRDFLNAAKRFSMTDGVTLRAIDGVHISETKDMAPTYQLGFAVRADAEAWLDLLGYSQTTELFRNALHQTARHYAVLLAKAVTRSSAGASTDLALIPLPADIPSHLKKKFSDTVRLQLGNNADVYSDALKLWS
jgi:hypothetical protein